MIAEVLPWYRGWWTNRPRCRAVRERRYTSAHYGRCELISPHPNDDHALDRGIVTPRWSTDWTA